MTGGRHGVHRLSRTERVPGLFYKDGEPTGRSYRALAAIEAAEATVRDAGLTAGLSERLPGYTVPRRANSEISSAAGSWRPRRAGRTLRFPRAGGFRRRLHVRRRYGVARVLRLLVPVIAFISPAMYEREP